MFNDIGDTQAMIYRLTPNKSLNKRIYISNNHCFTINFFVCSIGPYINFSKPIYYYTGDCSIKQGVWCNIVDIDNYKYYFKRFN